MLAYSWLFFASLKSVSTRDNVYVRLDLANVIAAPPAFIGSGVKGDIRCIRSARGWLKKAGRKMREDWEENVGRKEIFLSF